MNTEFIRKPAASVFARALANKHTSSMGLVIAGAELARGLSRTWFPQYHSQIDETVKDLQHFAIAYALLMAGDSKPQNAEQTPKP